MREEPGERVFDIPEDAIPVRPAQPKAVPAKPAASIPSAPKPQTAIHSAAPVSGDWWKALSENCKGQIPPMYRAFLDLCGGTLEGDQITVDIDEGTLTLHVDDDELARRRAAWQPPAPKYTKGVLARYARLVSCADKGAILQ